MLLCSEIGVKQPFYTQNYEFTARHKRHNNCRNCPKGLLP